MSTTNGPPKGFGLDEDGNPWPSPFLFESEYIFADDEEDARFELEAAGIDIVQIEDRNPLTADPINEPT